MKRGILLKPPLIGLSITASIALGACSARINGSADALYQKGTQSPLVIDPNPDDDNPTPGLSSSLSFLATIPFSPSNSSVTPSVVGTITEDAVVNSVRLFRDEDCLLQIASGSRQDFEGGGIPISVVSNSVTFLYGKADRADGTLEACQFLTVYEHDDIRPELSFEAPSLSQLSAETTASVVVNYSGADSVMLSPSQVSMRSTGNASCSIQVLGEGTASRVLRLSSCTGQGTVVLAVADGTAQDAAGNISLGAEAPDPITVDTLPPILTLGSLSATRLNSSGSATLELTYTGADSVSLMTADLNLLTTGSANCQKSISGTGSTSRIVTLSSCTGTGTVTLSVNPGTARDLAGNLALGAGPTETLMVDNAGPSLSIGAPSATQIGSSGSVSYSVSYTGADSISLNASNISLVKTGNADCSTVNVSGTGLSTRVVQVSGCSGSGTIAIHIAAASAQDSFGNSAPAAGPSANFSVDTLAPMLAISTPSRTHVNSSESASYTLTYSDAQSISLGLLHISLDTTGTARCTPAVSGSGNSIRVVTLSGCSGNGTVGILVAANTAVDAAGNFAPSAASTVSLIVDTQGPTLAIGAPSKTYANSNAQINFDLTYEGADTISLSSTAITLNRTGTADCAVAIGSMSANVRRVNLSGCTGNGTIGISVAAGTATDAAGNSAPAAGPSQTFDVDNTQPTLALSAPSATSVNNTGIVNFTLSYGGAASVTLSESDITLVKTGTANCVLAHSGTGTVQRTASLSSCTGTGSVAIQVAAGTASDVAGNLAPAAGPSQAFAVSQTGGGPQISFSTPSLDFARNGQSVQYTVTYSGASSITLSASNITLEKTGNALCSVAVTGSGSMTRTVTLTSCTGNGTVGLRIAAATAVDASGSQAPAAGPSPMFTVDNVQPTLALSAPSSSLVSGSENVNYTATYSGADTISLTASDVQLSTTGTASCSKSVSGTGTSTRTITLSSCTGVGTVAITVLAGSASDLAGNVAAAAGPSATFSVDAVGPTLAISAPSSNLVSGSSSVSFTLSYGGADMISLSTDNITVIGTGSASCQKSISGTGTLSRVVSLSACTGNGTVRISVAAATAQDNAGNLAPAAGPSASVSVDTSGPTLALSAPSVSLATSSTSVTYTVSYTGADSVTLSSAQVNVSTTGSASCSKTVSGTGTSTRTVTLSSCTGDGTVAVSIAAGTASDLAGNLAPASSVSTGLTVDNSLPTLAIGPASTAGVNSNGSVSFTLTYTDATSINLAASHIVLSTTGTASCAKAVSGSGTGTRTVTLSSCSGNGDVTFTVAAGSASDSSGNQAPAAGPSQSVNVDNTAPTLAISAPSSSLISASGSVSYTVTYVGANTITLSASDVSLVTTGTATCSKAVSGTGSSNRTITLSSCSGSGTIAISIAAGTATDAVGNSALASGSSASFSIDSDGPSIVIGAPSSSAVRSSGSVSFPINYTGADSVTLTASDIQLNLSGTAACSSKTVSGTGLTSRTLTLSGCSGDGAVSFSIIAGTAQDSAANSAPAAGPSASVQVDNTAPSIALSAPSLTQATASSSIVYTVTYSGADSVTLDSTQVNLVSTGTASCSKAVSGTGTSTRTITLSSCTGDGTVAVSVSAGSARDTAGNLAPSAGPATDVNIDNSAPTLAISAPSNSAVTSLGSVSYLITYSGASSVTLLSSHVGLVTTGSAACTKSVTGSGTTARTVTLSSCTGSGTVAISIAAGTASDAVGNTALGSGPSAAFTVDSDAPGVVIGAPSRSSVTSAESVAFSISYTGADTVTLASSHITLNTTGNASCSGKVVSGTGITSRTVTVSGCTGDGSVSISLVPGTAQDMAGNQAPAAGPSASVNVDNSIPTLTLSAPSIAQANSASTIVFTATYSGADTVSLAAAQVNLITTGNATCTKAVTGTGTSTRTITLSFCTGDGTVAVSVAAGSASDATGNQAPAAGPSAAVTVDNTGPTLALSAPSSATVAGSGSVSYTVTYSGASAVTLAATQVNLITTGSASCTKGVTGTGSTSRTVILSGCSGSGTVAIAIAAGTAVDTVGNAAPASATSGSFSVDSDGPSLVIGAPSSTSIRSTGTITYPVTYAGADAVTLANSHVSLNLSGTAACSSKTVSGTGLTSRTITLSGCTGDGAVSLSIAAGTAQDSAGNFAPAVGPSDSFTVDNTGPTLVLSAPSLSFANSSATVVFTATYSGATSITLAPAQISLTTTGNATCSKAVSGTGTTTRTISLSSCTGDGTVAISVSAGSAADTAGNAAPAAGPTATFTVDNTAPVLAISSPSSTLIAGSGSVSYTITYGGASDVTLATAHINLVTTGSATCVKGVSGTGTVTRMVTLSSCTGTGTVAFSIGAGSALDTAGNPIPASGTSSSFTVDSDPPGIMIGAPSIASISSSNSVNFPISYTGADTVTLASSNITLNTTGNASCSSKTVSGTGVVSRTITLSGCTGDGSVSISIAANTAQDLAGNQTPAAGPSTSVNVDNAGPTLALSAPSLTAVKSDATITITATYSGASTITLSAAQVTLAATGTATCSKTVTGTGTSTRTITLTSCTGDGTVAVSVAAGTATDASGNPAPAAGPTASVTVDNTAPTLALSAPSSATVSGAGSVTYTVTYTGASAVTLAAAQVNLVTTGSATCAKAVSGSGTATRTVTLSSCSGTGTIAIAIAAGTATDALGNSAAASPTSTAFSIDSDGPSLVIGAPSSTLIQSASAVTFPITYSGADAVSLANTHVNLTYTGTVACPSKTVSGTGLTSRTITISGCTGNGTVALAIVAGTAADTAGNQAPAAGPSASVSVDNNAPGLVIGAPSLSLANSSSSIVFTATYSGADSVTLASAQVSLVTTGSATCAKTVSGTGTATRTITLSSCTGDGSVSISIAAGTASDTAGNSAAAAGPSATVTIDNTAPTLALSAPSSTQVSGAGSVSYSVTYGGASSVTLAATQVNLVTTGSANCVKGVSGTGTTARTVTLSSCSGSGTVAIAIVAGTATDAAGNTAPASGTSASFSMDNTPPSVIIGAPSLTLIRSSDSVSFPISYSGADSVTLASSHITLNATGTAACASKTVSGTGLTSRTVTLSACSGDGTLTMSLAAGTASDNAGNQAAPAGPSASVTVDATGPTLTIGQPSSSSIDTLGSVAFTVTYNGADTITLADSHVTLTTTGTASCSRSVSYLGTYTRGVTLSNCSGRGTVSFSIAAGTARDVAGNLSAAAGPSATVSTPFGAATRLAVTGPSVLIGGTCAAYKVTIRDASNNLSESASSRTITVTGTGSAAIYRDSTCATAGATLSFATGANQGMFYLRDSATENITLTASSTGLTAGTLSVGVKAITGTSVGGYHACAIFGGGLQCWGRNVSGQLGNGTMLNSRFPSQVVGLKTGVTGVAAGGNHTCAIVSGAVWCWGENLNGQLGNNSTTNSSVPVQVSGLSSGVIGITAGESHSCAILSNNSLRCWGLNTDGQLGNSSTTQSLIPVQVTGLTSGVTHASAGSDHTCAVVNGGARCWGASNRGQVGNGSTSDATSPVSVTGLTSGVSKVSASQNHSCALLADQTLRCWGYNSAGQLGDNTFTQSATPVSVLNMPAPATSIVTGYYHSCATTTTGATVCWGRNNYGQIGDGTSTSRRTPTQVIGTSSGSSLLASGSYTTCTLVSGIPYCWGFNNYGQIGNETASLGFKTSPQSVPGIVGAVTDVSGGESHTCFVAGGSVQCGGINGGGQLGNSTNTSSFSPVQVTNLTSGILYTSAGESHSCSVSNTGQARCWGSNDYGQLGNSTTTSSNAPVAVTNLTTTAADVGAGENHSCALTTSGGMRCWGRNNHGQLGNNSTTNSSAPVTPSGLTSGVSAISVGQFHSCAVQVGAAKCWGRNLSGQLGDGTLTQRNVPTLVSGLNSGVSAISAGQLHSCAIMTDNSVRCWGKNNYGQLGINSTVDSRIPVRVVGLPGIPSAITTGYYHTCAVSSGEVYCWGRNQYGQLGTGNQVNTLLPVKVPGLSGVGALEAGNYHTCATIQASGELRCWGNNAWGALALNDIPMQPMPLAVGPFTIPEDKIEIFDSNGSWQATFTRGAQTVLTKGPTRMFWEQTVQDPVFRSVTHGYWVRTLPDPFIGEVDQDWLQATLQKNRDGVPDILDFGFQYIDGATEVFDNGIQIAGDAQYGPLQPDGSRLEGADFTDYLGVAWDFPDRTVAPSLDMYLSLDCSGFMRMIWGYRGGLPLSFDPLSDNSTIPRKAYQILDNGPGMLIVPNAGTKLTDHSRIQIGDLVFFDADPADGTQIDHVGMYLGVDSDGDMRFISSRKSINGPTLGDYVGRSILNSSGGYPDALRAVRRF